jgi:hypothetical protein
MAGGKGESDILTPFPGHMGGGGGRGGMEEKVDGEEIRGEMKE